MELEEQGVPDANCPECGGEPEYDPRHQLSAVGYLHDDIQQTCSECGNEWVHGHPVGINESELAEKLRCDACIGKPQIPEEALDHLTDEMERRMGMGRTEDGDVCFYGRVHRVNFSDDEYGVKALRLHVKCPNCYHFWVWNRDVGRGQITVLVGHPATVGDINEAEITRTYHEDEV